jgi:hypothetical protein
LAGVTDTEMIEQTLLEVFWMPEVMLTLPTNDAQAPEKMPAKGR